MDIIALLINTFVKVVVKFTIFGIIGIDMVEEDLRAPLDHLGVHGWPQILIVVLVPVLTMIGVWRIMQGFLRFAAMTLLALMALHILWPLVGIAMHGEI